MNPIAPTRITWEGLYDEVIETFRRPAIQIILSTSSQGGGVIWSSDGLIMTRAHVSKGSSLVRVQDGRCGDAELLPRERETDLPMLRLPAGGFVSAKVRNSRRLRAGEEAVAVGHPRSEAGAIRYAVCMQLLQEG